MVVIMLHIVVIDRLQVVFTLVFLSALLCDSRPNGIHPGGLCG